MAATKFTGGKDIASTDYHAIKWVGTTKDNKSVTIEINNAICISNLELTFAEKDDVVPEIEFEGCYPGAAQGEDEPWTITVGDGVTSGAKEIVLGAGLFYIDSTLVGLTRGGGSFTREMEIREINADGDRGKVKDRVVIDGARPKLKMNVLQWLVNFKNFGVGLKTST